MTIREILNEGTKKLKAPQINSVIDTPALDATLLLAHSLQIRREDLILRENEKMDKVAAKIFFDYINRRMGGECIAYILGRKEFRAMDFMVNPHVLVPRPDTEIIVETVIEYIDSLTALHEEGKNGLSLLDLCTGSGAIGISIKKERPLLAITASDISPEALRVAKDNAAKLLKFKTEEREAGVDFILSDLFEKIDGKFNIIVSNPPYIRTDDFSSLAPEVHREPALALDGGRDGLDKIKKIITHAPDYLKQGGRLFLEAAPEQMPAISNFFSENGYCNIMLHKDLGSRERVISASLMP